jgi:hypothetical protein
MDFGREPIFQSIFADGLAADFTGWTRGGPTVFAISGDLGWCGHIAFLLYQNDSYRKMKGLPDARGAGSPSFRFQSSRGGAKFRGCGGDENWG